MSIVVSTAGFPATQGNQGKQGKISFTFPVREKTGIISIT